MKPQHRIYRTILQLIAGGALTALVAALVNGLAPGSVGMIMAAWTTIVAVTQNSLEGAGVVPTLFSGTTPPSA